MSGTNYSAVQSTDGFPQTAVYDPGSGAAMPIAAGTVSTDANHNSQKYAPMQVQLAAGSGLAGAVKVTDSGGTNQLAVSSQGQIHAILDANSVATYSATVTGLAVATSPTDVAILNGSASKVVRVTRIAISASTNSAVAATNDVQIILRTTANTGTSSAMTIVQYDSNDPAVSATAVSYTANPSPLGSTTGGGVLYVQKLVPTINPFTATDFPTQAPVIIQWGITDSKPIVLRGVAQGLAVNFNGVTLTGTNSVDITFEWTESAN